MKIIKPSFEVIENQLLNIVKHIEKCGRVCYKSEDKITEESADKFVKTIVNLEHLSVLEHGNIIIRFNDVDICDCFIETIKKINCIYYSAFPITVNRTYAIISANVRQLFNLFKHSQEGFILSAVETFLSQTYPQFFKATEGLEYNLLNNNFEIINADDLITDEERLNHEYETVKFIVDRGVMAEITRHRQAVFSVESTRYCNYSQGKFDKEITVIEPCFFNDKDNYNGLWNNWYTACENAEYQYFNLLATNSATPQQARAVLPQSLKSEVIMTTNLKGWKHFLKLRTAKEAHPQMREVATPLLNHFKATKHTIFDDIKGVEWNG